MTGISGMLGRFTPGLRARIAGSRQLVILPVKMRVIRSEFRRSDRIRSPVEGSFRLYMKAVPPATSGTYW